jgi:hypothetical protein
MLDLFDEKIRSGPSDPPKGRSGLNHQTDSSGSSGASDRPDPIIFWVSQRLGPARWRTAPGRGRVSMHCNVKMIYKSVLAQYLVTIYISPVLLPTTKKILPPHTQEKSIVCNAELDNVDDIDRLPVPESKGTIPEERINGWWLNKLERSLPNDPIVDMVRSEEDEEVLDLYG